MERQHLTTRIQVPSRTLVIIHWVFRAQGEIWQISVNSCSVVSSTMCTAKMRRHYGFLPLTASCVLLALVIYKVTCYWHHESNSVSWRHQLIHLSIRHILPTCCYTIVSWSWLSGHTLSCVLVAIEDVERLWRFFKTKGLVQWGCEASGSFLERVRGYFIFLS